MGKKQQQQYKPFLSLRHLKHQLNCWKNKKQKKKSLHPKKKYRFTKWFPGLCYKLIKPAQRSFSSLQEIYAAYQNKKLDCNCLAEFCHKDKHIPRFNRNEPRYAALFCLTDGTFIQPQQPHYRQCYQNSKRTNRECAETLLKDNTPYWCCVYADRLHSERVSKKRYTQKKKNLKKGGAIHV